MEEEEVLLTEKKYYVGEGLSSGFSLTPLLFGGRLRPMDALSPNSQGTETNEALVPASVPCPLNDLPQNVHNYIHALEERLRVVENALRDNHERTKAMGTMIFNNPATKMFLAALPKEAQTKLKEMFGGQSNAVTEKTDGNGNS